MKFRKPLKISELSKRKIPKADCQGEYPEQLSDDLTVNLERLKAIFHATTDLVFREFNIGMERGFRAALVCIDGLTERRTIDVDIMASLMHLYRIDSGQHQEPLRPDILRTVRDLVLMVAEIKDTDRLEEGINAILAGDALLLLDGSETAIICNVRGWDKRGVAPPATESVVRGPQEAFTETLRVNTALIRRRLRDPDLVFDMFRVGRRTRTDIALGYIKGIVNPDLTAELTRRLESIDVDGILDSGYLENIIENSAFSPFPQFQHTERPDKAVANLLEGRIVLIVDGSPFVLLAPAVFAQFYQSPEDYYEKSYIGSATRFLRFFSIFIALALPGLYVALASFHPEMLPTPLALAIAGARTGVPFSVFLEILLMEAAVEILREASIRLPGLIGPTIGIVGAIVLGDAAVSSGIVSSLTVVIVAITTIASYTSPSYNTAIAVRLLRFAVTAAAAVLGLYGLMLSLIIIIVHLTAYESLGVPYLAPMAPFYLNDQKDVLMRLPIRSMVQRPIFLQTRDRRRMRDSRKGDDDKDG